MNYATLVSRVQEYLEEAGTTFVADIDDFIRLAEERIVRSTKHPAFRTQATPSFTISTKTLSKPTGFLAPYHFKVVDGTRGHMLIPVEQGFIEEAYPLSSYSGRPRYYASRDESTFLVGPIPDAAYTTEISYYRLPTSIVTASTTWIGDNAENALLYGTITEGYRFMKGNAEVMQMYEAQFQSALADLRKLGADRPAFDEYYTQIESI